MHETIAVVDDEPDILELVSLHLKKNHFNVREFADGSAFIKYLNSEKPDLVVLDLMLPDADGFEICKYMKRKKNLSPIPIVMLTAKSEETDTTRVIQTPCRCERRGNGEIFHEQSPIRNYFMGGLDEFVIHYFYHIRSLGL